MKIIISHDVDHIDSTDHLFKDLILEKMIVRSFWQLVHHQINKKTFFYRVTMVFHKRMNRIDELMEFDKRNGIPSVFFFGMQNALGMSYKIKKVEPLIKNVLQNGFDVGVHGCDYLSLENIKMEHDKFEAISNIKEFGIRNHYVRFDDETFEKMNKAGYLFDTTQFNREKAELVGPYKVGNMWEFPLHIMDGYVCKQGYLQEGLDETYHLIEEADQKKVRYCTILFHDYQYDDRFDPQRKEWYEKTIDFCKKKGYEFVSYREAIKELENESNRVCE